MAKTHWNVIFQTFIASCISLALYIVSISTENWIQATAIYKDLNATEEINYGLFSGSAIRQVLAARTKFELTVICDFSESICMYSCQDSKESRETEIKNVLNGESFETCPLQSRFIQLTPLNRRERNEEILGHPSSECIPAGYWICTILSISVAIIFTVVSGVFSLINMVYSPIEPIFSILGLYIWNGIATGFSFLSIVLWGALFDQHLKDNVATTDTLNPKVNFVSKGRASIGFSYYIALVALICNLICIGLLILRAYLLKRNAEPPSITIEKHDSPLEFY